MDGERMPFLHRLSTTFLLAMAVVLSVCAEDPPTGESTRLAAFDAAWKCVADHHYDAKMKGVDWDAVKRQFRTQAQAAKNDEELRGVIRSMLGKIGESHFALIPAETAKEIKPEEALHRGGDLGMETRLVEGRLTVVSVDANGPAAKEHYRVNGFCAGLQPAED
jgi:C-terminal processing protease CtpA/Prc